MQEGEPANVTGGTESEVIKRNGCAAEKHVLVITALQGNGSAPQLDRIRAAIGAHVIHRIVVSEAHRIIERVNIKILIVEENRTIPDIECMSAGVVVVFGLGRDFKAAIVSGKLRPCYAA